MIKVTFMIIYNQRHTGHNIDSFNSLKTDGAFLKPEHLKVFHVIVDIVNGLYEGDAMHSKAASGLNGLKQ